MYQKLLSIVCVLILSTVYHSCTDSTEDGSVTILDDSPQVVERKNWKPKYAGKYAILLKTEDKPAGAVEIYTLNEDGTAYWIWNGSSKSGYWYADSTVITTVISGNTGPIRENYFGTLNTATKQYVFANEGRWLYKMEDQ